MSRLRPTCRRSVRSTVRRLARSAVRVRWRAPDDLGAALTAFGRAVRSQRRLARLAPRFFDSAVVERERRQNDARRSWMAEWEPILAKAYGSDPPPPPDPNADLPPLPPPAVCAAVDHELASFKFWLTTGDLALERHCRRRPHALPNFGRLARLLKIGFEFGRLASGADSTLPDPESDYDPRQKMMADLERAYGHKFADPSAPPDVPAAPSPPSPPVKGPEPPPALPASTTSATSAELNPGPPPAVASGASQIRSDAWSRWARQIRRLRHTR